MQIVPLPRAAARLFPPPARFFSRVAPELSLRLRPAAPPRNVQKQHKVHGCPLLGAAVQGPRGSPLSNVKKKARGFRSLDLLWHRCLHSFPDSYGCWDFLGAAVYRSAFPGSYSVAAVSAGAPPWQRCLLELPWAAVSARAPHARSNALRARGRSCPLARSRARVDGGRAARLRTRTRAHAAGAGASASAGACTRTPARALAHAPAREHARMRARTPGDEWGNGIQGARQSADFRGLRPHHRRCKSVTACGRGGFLRIIKVTHWCLGSA